MPVAEQCRAHGISSASFYEWRAKYGKMDASFISQMKAMEEESRRLIRSVTMTMRHTEQADQDLRLGNQKSLNRQAGRSRAGFCAIAVSD